MVLNVLLHYRYFPICYKPELCPNDGLSVNQTRSTTRATDFLNTSELDVTTYLHI